MEQCKVQRQPVLRRVSDLFWQWILEKVHRWKERSRQKRELRQLAELDDFQLKDIGISRADVMRITNNHHTADVNRPEDVDQRYGRGYHKR